MRRWLPVAALVTGFLTATSSAQHMGGGGHIGGFGGHVGGSFSGHSGFVSHSPAGSMRAPSMGYHASGFVGPHPGFRPGFGSPRGPVFPGHFPHYPRGYPWWGWGYASPWGWSYAYPWWYGGLGWYGDYGWYDNNSYVQYYPNPDYQTDYSSQTNQLDQQQAEIDRLNDEVARLREEQQSSQPAARQHPGFEPTELVFRDKRTEEIQNYAIVGQTLWVLTADRARKIPLSDLDIAATKKANEDRGVEFEIPK